jgi:hypothetical protein
MPLFPSSRKDVSLIPFPAMLLITTGDRSFISFRYHGSYFLAILWGAWTGRAGFTSVDR